MSIQLTDFVAYVGDPDIHDGRIIRILEDGYEAHVMIEAVTGRYLGVSFYAVTHVEARQPEGMVLYALAELKAQAPARRFVFVNWDEEDEAYLEVVAEEFIIREIGHPPH